MKATIPEMFFKTIWVLLTLFTLYVFGWMTILIPAFDFNNDYNFNFWNLTLPSFLTGIILILYAKEIFIGYKPKSKRRIKISLIFYSLLIIILSICQIPIFSFMYSGGEIEYWQIILSLIIILTSYVGLILNRILKFRDQIRK